MSMITSQSVSILDLIISIIRDVGFHNDSLIPAKYVITKEVISHSAVRTFLFTFYKSHCEYLFRYRNI